MSWGEEQQKEIETIRERKIIVKLRKTCKDRFSEMSVLPYSSEVEVSF